jgi:hypothetical protein
MAAVAVLEPPQFPQRRAVTQHLALSLRLVAATAESERVHQPTVVLVAVAVGIIPLKESLSELPVKVNRVAVQTALVTVLVVAVVVLVVLVLMRLRNIVAAPVESVSLR